MSKIHVMWTTRPFTHLRSVVVCWSSQDSYTNIVPPCMPVCYKVYYKAHGSIQQKLDLLQHLWSSNMTENNRKKEREAENVSLAKIPVMWTITRTAEQSKSHPKSHPDSLSDHHKWDFKDNCNCIIHLPFSGVVWTSYIAIIGYTTMVQSCEMMLPIYGHACAYAASNDENTSSDPKQNSLLWNGPNTFNGDN